MTKGEQSKRVADAWTTVREQGASVQTKRRRSYSWLEVRIQLTVYATYPQTPTVHLPDDAARAALIEALGGVA